MDDDVLYLTTKKGTSLSGRSDKTLIAANDSNFVISTCESMVLQAYLTKKYFPGKLDQSWMARVFFLEIIGNRSGR